MKRMIMLTILLLTLFGVIGAKERSEGAEITFEHLSHDFGTLKHGGDKVTHLFEFTNTGTAPLIITRTTTSCRCISIKYPKRPVKAGQKGTIEVTYDPKDARVFNKGIDIHANIEGGTLTLFVKGVVE